MSESVVRLKMDSQQFSGNLKEARNEMLMMHQQAIKLQDGMSLASKEEVEFIKGLGSIKTSARGVQGQMRELTTSYMDFKNIYDKMSADEKASPAGKALAASLEQLKERTREAGSEIKNANKDLNDSEGFINKAKDKLNDLADKYGLNIQKLGLFGAALAASKTAFEIAKDALQQNQAEMATWGRLTADNESLYRGFLSAINNGDISGYISNINTIVDKATQAFNAMAALKKESTYNSGPVAEIDAQITRYQNMIKYGRFISDGNKKNAFGLKTGDRLSADMIKNLKRQLANLIKNKAYYSQEHYDMLGNAISALQGRKAAENNIDLKDYKQGTSSYDELNKRDTGARNFVKWNNENARVKIVNGNTGEVTYRINQNMAANNPYKRYAGWVSMLKNDDTETQIVNMKQQQEQTKSDIFNTIGRSFRAESKGDRIIAKLNNPSSGTTQKTIRTTKSTPKINTVNNNEPEIGSYDDLSNMVQRLRKEWRATADGDTQKKLQSQIDSITNKLEEMENKARNIEIKPDFSVMNSNNIDTYISNIKQKLEAADIGSDVWKQLNDNLSQAQQFSDLIKTATENGVDTTKSKVNFWDGGDFTDKMYQVANVNPQQGDFGKTWKNIVEGKNIDTSEWQNIVDEINDKLSTIGEGVTISLDPVTNQIKKVDKEAKKTSDDSQDMGKAITSVAQLGAAFASIGGDSKTAAMGQIAVAIAQMIGAFTSKLATEPGGVWNLIAAIGAGMTTIVSAASAFKSAGSFSTGGIVGGNNPSGDRLTANVNSGELILNTAQQNAVASELSGNSRISQNQKQDATPYLTGEIMWLGVNNHLRRIGKGEIVTTRG